ncbi:DUF6262 family protein [Mycobacterium sp. smrl_JER01]|uniref:DUF6262 family protein n=1 Tax=Mycobacterium sp. smrl_JER01 TaxID=3402633 RepID=UPI003ACA8987
MTAARSTAGLRKASAKSRNDARRKIRKALREMQRAGMTINPNAVARHAGVARKTIYNHTDLFDEIRAASAIPRPTIAATESEAPIRGSSVDAALRQQLRTQKRQYDNDIAALKAEIKELNQQLAAAHGEIHRLRGNGTANNS